MFPSSTHYRGVDLLLSNTPSPPISKCKQQPPPVCVILRGKPSLRPKSLRLGENVLVDEVHRQGLAAHNGLVGQPVTVDRTAPLGNIARQRHGNRGEAPQTFAHDGVEIRELVKRHASVGPQKLFAQCALRVQGAGLRELPHQEAQRVARRVDAGGHVVEALGRPADGIDLARLFLQPAQEGKLRGGVSLVARVQDVAVGQRCLARLGHQG
jgi:hypothetical protein